jgi:hypothetical protein
MLLAVREVFIPLLEISCMSGLSVREPLGQISGLGLFDGEIIDELLDLLPELAVLGVGGVELLAPSMEIGVQCFESLWSLTNVMVNHSWLLTSSAYLAR